MSVCCILASFFVANPRVTCACTWWWWGSGSHRYNGVRRERISGGSLTFPFVGSRDALGKRVIRFRPFAGSAELSSCPRGLPIQPGAAFRRSRPAKPLVMLRSLSLLHLAFVNVAKRHALPASRSRAFAFAWRSAGRDGQLSRDNFVQTQIIHCYCGRKRLSDGIRNYMLNQEGAFCQIICKCAALPRVNTREIYYRRISSGYRFSYRFHCCVPIAGSARSSVVSENDRTRGEAGLSVSGRSISWISWWLILVVG